MQGRKYYSQLLKKKYRYQEKKFLIEGKRFCREALIKEQPIEAAFVSEDFLSDSEWPLLEEHLRLQKIPHRVMTLPAFNSLTSTGHPQGIVMAVKMPRDDSRRPDYKKLRFVLLLDGIRDPGNLGTLIRTADWFGVEAIMLSTDSVDPYNSKVLRSTMGSIFEVPVYVCEDLIEVTHLLKDYQFRIVASAIDAEKSLEHLRASRKFAIILGGEANGVSASLRQAADIDMRIRCYGKAESLNVAIAGGVFMDHASRLMRGK